MEQHVSWLTQFVNHYLGGLALAVLSALHIKPNHPEMPIPEHVVMAMTVLVLGTVLALVLRSRLSVERPGPSQQIAEMLLTNPMGFGIHDVLAENAGHHWQKYVPMVGSIALFILLSNLLGVIPLFTSPTANATVPLACAIITFVYFNWQGLTHHGPPGYAKHFAGPLWWLSPTVRLWANIFASDLIYGLFLGLFTAPVVWAWTKSPILGIVLGVLPALVPIAFILLHVFVSVVQTYVFAILPAVYIGLATADEH